MYMSLALLLLIVCCKVYAVPTEQIFQRDVNTACANGGTPILYNEYHGDKCPPNRVLNSDGSCPMEYLIDCKGYCEIRTTFTYVQEVPIGGGYCHGPVKCGVTEMNQKTITWKVDVSLPELIKKMLQIGVTGGWSTATAKTQVLLYSIDLKEKECGYITFLPEQRESCGTYTEGQQFQPDMCIRGKTTANACYSEPFWADDGQTVIAGATVLVRTDCSNNKRLADKYQDKAYLHPGVAMPQSQVDNLLFVNADCVCAGGDCDQNNPSCCLTNTCGGVAIS